MDLVLVKIGYTRPAMRRHMLDAFLLAATCATGGCGSPTTPSTAQPLPFVSETATMRYYAEPGDSINIPQQEAFNTWAIGRLGIVLPQKVEYRKYPSRDAMARYTGQGNTNAYAEPERFTIHTIWTHDNHEVVHVYSSLVGSPSEFFNEGLAVSFQTDPIRDDFTVMFNGIQVHDACRSYLRAGTLPAPLSRYVTTNEFRSLTDQVLSYQMAGSFVLFLEERHDLGKVLDFFRTSGRDDSLATIRTRFQQAFGATLDQAESDWRTMLQ